MIDPFENRKPTWGTHLPPLMACVLATDGPVLELGCGIWSTPVLSAYCKATGREFVSMEARPEWAEAVSQRFGVEVVGWDTGNLLRAWSVVLVDHDPSDTRVDVAVGLRDLVEFVVLHDTRWFDVLPQMGRMRSNFKFCSEYVRLDPPTMVASNYQDITHLFKKLVSRMEISWFECGGPT